MRRPSLMCCGWVAVLGCALATTAVGQPPFNDPPPPPPEPRSAPLPEPMPANPTPAKPTTAPREPAKFHAHTPQARDQPSAEEHYNEDPWCESGGYGNEWLSSRLAMFHEFTSRNSQTHGRSTGLGMPLRGTSWLNRPYEVTVDFGALMMAGKPATGVRSANDHFLAVRAGWDWDHYWGGQASLGWSTPDLNAKSGAVNESDNLFITDVSLLYYPWGDSRIRPYWRMGMGLTDIEFTNLNGVRTQEYLFTIPFGVGVKHQFRRWLVAKAEIVDNLAFGMNEANTLNNLTLTFGLEARFGGRPTGYWAWHPHGYKW